MFYPMSHPPLQARLQSSLALLVMAPFLALINLFTHYLQLAFGGQDVLLTQPHFSGWSVR